MSDTFQVTPWPLEAIPGVIQQLNATFKSGKTLSLEWRKQQLRNVWKMVDENEDAFREALTKDIGKPLVQTQVLEFTLVKNDTKDCLDNLDKWLEIESVAVPSPFENWSPTIHRRPKGTCLIIGAWNYPITLTLLPFIGLVASGNTGIIKPSELAPHTATLLATLFPKYLDTTCFAIVNGDKTVVQALLKQPFGHVLYTGSAGVGREIMRAAAQHLTPVTLELGGRNSVVVTADAKIELTATRIAWSKFAIAGQTCFAPNHVIVHEKVYDAFVDELKKTYQSYYQGKPEWKSVGKIVNNAHWERIMSLISSSKGQIILGGKGNKDERFIEPTVVIDMDENDSTVETEIFGPILPVIKYSTIGDVERLLQKLSPDALALYVFTENLEEANKIISLSSTGTASINDCMAQIAPTSLPFGGFGKSGFGSYRGRASIETFSHKQSITTVPTVPEFEALMGWRYPYAESMETVKFVKANLEVPL